MMNNETKYSRVWGVLVVIVILGVAWKVQPITLTLADPVEKAASLLGTLIFLSLFIERAIEVFLSAWRSTGADELDRTIASRKLALEKFVSLQPDDVATQESTQYQNLSASLEEIEKERAEYRAGSRFISQWLGLGIGMMIAFIGIRIIGTIVEPPVLKGSQKALFLIVDIVFTGAVLAGGSESINKIMKVYNNAMVQTIKKSTS
ncbi:hypothetical protein HWQ46_00265 [Shewanella sp. D64]|uniref:hypothetical protein n=1 Tax=unclassified Shewanella TaxID=196818 RepID=UPI0022BA4CC3|nr:MULTISPECIES: hypothetical protein [unclassified Shewanella]MEC4723985.1 hypothetical protein [Shewanella sp. D64]MEC4736005.1 hypothetical protein [Shewanella sp. E94]WBJ93034.1 hypothetical protein HWQ47_13645 [Shewanella sp. MTB7]